MEEKKEKKKRRSTVTQEKVELLNTVSVIVSEWRKTARVDGHKPTYERISNDIESLTGIHFDITTLHRVLSNDGRVKIISKKMFRALLAYFEAKGEWDVVSKLLVADQFGYRYVKEKTANNGNQYDLETTKKVAEIVNEWRINNAPAGGYGRVGVGRLAQEIEAVTGIRYHQMSYQRVLDQKKWKTIIAPKMVVALLSYFEMLGYTETLSKLQDVLKENRE